MKWKQIVLCKDCKHVLLANNPHLKGKELEFARCKIKRKYYTGSDAHDCQYCDFANPQGTCKEYVPISGASVQGPSKPKPVLSKILDWVLK